jgi:hypothetical protein
MKRLLVAAGFASIAAGLLAQPAQAIPIEVECTGCDAFPLWAQVVLSVVGVGLAVVVLYVPYRLSLRARSPRRRALIRIGGVVILTVGLVVLARVAVLVLPDN